MKRALVSFGLFLVLLFIADDLRSRWVSAIVPTTGWAWNGWIAIAYAVPYGVAGALLSLRASRWTLGVLFALTLGLSIVALDAILNGIRPAVAFSHGQSWLHFLGWANLYMPPIGAVAGAVLAASRHMLRAG